MAADLADTPVTVNLLLPGARRRRAWCPTRRLRRSASVCSIQRSWGHRSSGWRPHAPLASMTSGSSRPSSAGPENSRSPGPGHRMHAHRCDLGRADRPYEHRRHPRTPTVMVSLAPSPSSRLPPSPGAPSAGGTTGPRTPPATSSSIGRGRSSGTSRRPSPPRTNPTSSSSPPPTTSGNSSGSTTSPGLGTPSPAASPASTTTPPSTAAPVGGPRRAGAPRTHPTGPGVRHAPLRLDRHDPPRSVTTR